MGKKGEKKTSVFHKIFGKIIKIIIKKINHSRFNFSIEFELLMIKRNHHLSFYDLYFDRIPPMIF